MKTNRTIFCVPCYDGHIRVFAPLIKRMEERHALEPLVVFLKGVHGDALMRFLDDHHLPYVVLDLSSRPTIVAGEAGLMRHLLFAIKFSCFLFDINTRVKRLFDEWNPALVITTNEGLTESYFIYQARKRGISSLYIPLMMYSIGLMTQTSNIQKYLLLTKIYRKLREFLRLPIHSIYPYKGHLSKVAAWSEKHIQSLVERGIPADRIVITGSPAHDRIFQQMCNQSDSDSIKIYEQLAIEKGTPIILYTSQPITIDGVSTPEEQRQFTEHIIDTCLSNTPYKLVIKLHPRESITDYKYLDNHPLRDNFRIVSEKDSDLYDLISIAIVMITQSSSTGLDAILFDKDMIIIDYLSPVQDPMDYIRSGAALGVNKEDDLLPALEKALTDASTQRELRANRKKFAAEYTCPVDGESAGRILELIDTMLYNGQI